MEPVQRPCQYSPKLVHGPEAINICNHPLPNRPDVKVHVHSNPFRTETRPAVEVHGLAP